MKRAMSRKPRRFVLSGQDSHALEPRHLLTTVNVGSLTGVLPLPNHVGLTIGHVVAPNTHGHASVGVQAAATGHTTHATLQHPQRHATANHPTATPAKTVAAPASTTNHIGAATSFHVGQVKDAATGLTFYRTQSKNPATGRATPTSTSALAVTHQLTALATPTAVSPNAVSTSSVVCDCTSAEADDEAYNKALAAYKLSAAAYSSKVAAYSGLVGLRNTAQATLDADIASMKSQFGVTPKISTETTIDPNTGKSTPPQLKVEIDLTGLISSFFGGANKLKQKIALDQSAYNTLKAQVAAEKVSVLESYRALQTELNNLINLRNQVLNDDQNYNCNIQPDGLPGLPDPLNDSDGDNAPDYDITYDLPPGFGDD